MDTTVAGNFQTSASCLEFFLITFQITSMADIPPKP